MPDADKATLRTQLVPSIIALAGATDKAVRAQVAETVAVIAKYDFPEQWTELVDVRISSLLSHIPEFNKIDVITASATRAIPLALARRVPDKPLHP